MDPNIAMLVAFFNQKDAKNTDRHGMYKMRYVGNSVFVPSSVVHLASCFQTLLADGVINPEKPVVDCGSGDGRVVAVMGALGLDALGIEAFRPLYDEALATLHVLWGEVMFPNSVGLAHGNFLREDTYDSVGTPFQKVGTFFNYICLEDAIARKIANQSPKGTAFLLYNAKEQGPYFPGLTLDRTLELDDPARILRHNVEGKIGERPTIAYLHAYRK